jgi:protein NrfC
MNEHDEERPAGKEVSRRQFLKMASVFAIGLGLGDALPQLLNLGEGVYAIPAAGGYLLVDTKKCAGCQSCMLACSLVHEGEENPTLARLQILQDPFGRFPDDLSQEQCRQCVFPACAEACPTGALHADAKTGNVRLVDEKKCIGCQRCVEACPQKPSRAVWNAEKKHSQKCDLCAKTPFWKEKGGPGGKQACVEVCPMRAITFTTKVPDQTGDRGYHVNLRGASWAAMGLTTDSGSTPTGGGGSGH